MVRLLWIAAAMVVCTAAASADPLEGIPIEEDLKATVAWTALAQERDADGAAESNGLAQGRDANGAAESNGLAQGRDANGAAESNGLGWTSPLVIVQCFWMVLVTLGAAWYARSIEKKNGGVIKKDELRGLNLPRGSLRGILALVTIGSFVNVMVLGAPVLGSYFSDVLAAFGTLTGSIVGFYFGTRGATPAPNKSGNEDPS